MNCAEVMRRLSDYVEGELGWWESLRLRSHLLRCEACARQFRVEMALNAKVATALGESVEAPDLSASIMAALPDRPAGARRNRSVRLVRAMAYGVAALSIGLGTMLCHSPVREPQRKHVVGVAPSVRQSPNAQPKAPEPVIEPKRAPAPELPRRERAPIEQVASSGRARKVAPKPEPTHGESQISVFSVTLSGRRFPSDDSPGTQAPVATAEVMGKPIKFSEGSTSIVERHLAENTESPDVERHPLESVIKTDPLADRIHATY